MIEIAILITFLIVFLLIFWKDRKDRERVDKILSVFDNTINNVLTAVEKTNNKFYEMVSKVEIQHFNNLEKHSDKQLKLLKDQTLAFLDALETKTPPPVIEKLSGIDEIEKVENDIEKEDREEFPLMDLPNIPISDGIKVQLEGEEEVFPINLENKII